MLNDVADAGEAGDLGYVSPKSGRAVSRCAGEPWHDRLLPLPAFLLDDAPARPSSGELADGFAVTGFFLGRYVFEPRGQHAVGEDRVQEHLRADVVAGYGR